MKQLKMTALLCLAVFAFISCNEGNNPTVTTAMEAPIPPPTNIISVEQADNYYKNYEGTRVPIIEEGVNAAYPGLTNPFKTSRFVTVDFAQMAEYIEFIEQESKDAGVTPNGLRIYFAATDGIKGTPGKETFFMNPVVNFKGVKGDISYAIATDATGKKTAVTVGSIIDSTESPISGANLLLQGGNTQSLAFNRGTFPPPPHPGDANDYH